MSIAHRKVNKRIRFVDAQGNPLSNKDIGIRQTNHKFLFGCDGVEVEKQFVDGNEEVVTLK